MVGSIIGGAAKGIGSLVSANFMSRGQTEIFDNQKNSWGDFGTAGNFSGSSAGSESNTYKSGERMGKYAQRMLDMTAAWTGGNSVAGSLMNKIKPTGNGPESAPGKSSWDAGYRPEGADAGIGVGDIDLSTPYDDADIDNSIPEPYESGTFDFDTGTMDDGMNARSGVYILPSRGGMFTKFAKDGAYVPNPRRGAGKMIRQGVIDKLMKLNNKIGEFGNESIYNRMIIGGTQMHRLGGLLGNAISPAATAASWAMILPRLEGDSSPNQQEWRKQRSIEQDAEYKGIRWSKPQLRMGGYFPEKNNDIMIKNRRRANNGLYVTGVSPIYGPSHEGGGINMSVGGRPIEAEGGEYKVALNKGDAIFNDDQMSMLNSGMPIEDIIATMPTMSSNAEDGTFFPDGKKRKKQFSQGSIANYMLFDKLDDIHTGQPFANKKEGREVFGAYEDNMFDERRIGKPVSPDIKLKEDRKKAAIKTAGEFTFDPSFTGTTKAPTSSVIKKGRDSKPTLPESVNPEDDLYARYKKNSKIAAGIEGVNTGVQFFNAFMARKRNMNQNAPIGVSPIKLPRNRPYFEDPTTYINEIDKGFISSANQLRRLGQPDLIPGLFANRADAISKVQQGVGGANIKSSIENNRMNSELDLKENMFNLDIFRANRDMLDKFETRKEQAIYSNDAAMNAASSRGSSIYGELTQKQLQADVIKEAARSKRMAGIMSYLFS